MRILALVIDWPLLSPRERANWVTGFLALLALIGMVALAIWLYAIASNPPLGWRTTTVLENVYLPPGFLLVEGVGHSQIEDRKEDYLLISEARGSQNFLVVSGEKRWDGVHLTYATYPPGGPLHLYTEEREFVKPSAPFVGQYGLIATGENRPRVDGKTLVLSWSYSVEMDFIIVVLLVVVFFTMVAFAWAIHPLLRRLFRA